MREQMSNNAGGTLTACPICGCTVEEFKRSGLLGCPACYTAMRALLSSVVECTQGTLRHEGSAPVLGEEAQYERVRALVHEQKRLKAEIETAMREKNYRLAEQLQAKLADVNHSIYEGERK